MEYLALAKMKKNYSWYKTKNEKQTVLFDLSALDRTYFTDSVIEKIYPEIKKFIGVDSVQSFIFATPVSTDDYELSIDMEFNRTHVYSKKTGKKLYTVKSVSGYRIAQYKRNIYGIAYGLPINTITYGSLGEHARRSYSLDVEI